MKSIKVKVKNKSQTWDWLVFCIKSPELKIVPVADTTAAWAFDVEVAAKQNDDKYVPYQGFASQERVDFEKKRLQRQQQHGDLPHHKTHVKLTVMTDPGGEVIRYTHRLCLQYRGGGDVDDDDYSCGRVSLF